MPTTYKVLGQLEPAATTESTLYTVPASTQTVCSTLSVCNNGTSDGTFRVRIKVNNAADDDGQYLFFDYGVAAKDTRTFTLGITLGAADVFRVYSSVATMSFSLFGSEIS
jgi:hypothetical protein